MRPIPPENIDFEKVDGLSYEYSHYVVRDRNGLEIHCVCPFCYAKNHLISILEKREEDYANALAYCPHCNERFSVRQWRMTEESRKAVEESKAKRKEVEEKFTKHILQSIHAENKSQGGKHGKQRF